MKVSNKKYPMSKKLLFISKDSNWQLYRNEVLTKLANEYDVEVEILTTGTLKEHIKGNDRVRYRFFHNLFKQASKISFFPGALRYIIKKRPDTVLALNATTQLTEYAAALLCKILGIRFVWWTHGFNHYQLKNRFLQNLKKRYALSFLSKGDSIITFSPAGKQYLVNNNIRAAKIFTASNTLDTDKLKLLKKSFSQGFDKALFLKSKFADYDPSANSIVLLFSGRLNLNKKVDHAIKVIKVLMDKGVNARLMIVGDGKEKAALTCLANQLGIHNNVYFAGSVFDDEMITPYFLASDLFLMPGYIGLAIVHAFAFDLPVITENVATHIEAMAVAIINIKNDSTFFESLKRGTSESIKHEANIHNMLSNMNAALFTTVKPSAS
jgi:1,2-diacylglycerol 3-alpha-glucosyltransferase